jgi:hypothetical protein
MTTNCACDTDAEIRIKMLFYPIEKRSQCIRPHRNSLAHGKTPQFAILNHAAGPHAEPRPLQLQNIRLGPDVS